MKIRVVEEVVSIFEVGGNPTPEMAKEIVRSRLQQESTLDMVDRQRTVKVCEVADEKAANHRVRAPKV